MMENLELAFFFVGSCITFYGMLTAILGTKSDRIRQRGILLMVSGSWLGVPFLLAFFALLGENTAPSPLWMDIACWSIAGLGVLMIPHVLYTTKKDVFEKQVATGE